MVHSFAGGLVDCVTFLVLDSGTELLVASFHLRPALWLVGWVALSLNFILGKTLQFFHNNWAKPSTHLVGNVKDDLAFLVRPSAALLLIDSVVHCSVDRLVMS